MLGNRKLIVDVFCEVKEFTKPWQDAEFWNFSQHDIEPGAVYIISRQQFTDNVATIRQLAQDKTILPVLGNPAEGSDTMLMQAHALGIVDLVQQGKIIIIAGGHMQSDIPYLYYENFLPKVLDYTENLSAIDQYSSCATGTRPYKFLFLNGRGRRHRRNLIQRLTHLLDTAIWTNLDSAIGPIKLLDPYYEFDFYKQQASVPDSGFVKYNLFNNDWGEIYLSATPYMDTYFSLVTETVFEYPYSFRTEKIWKPIAIGHPWIAVANAGYYRDLHNMGFQTFGHVIDESFDQIENNHDRLERIAQVVEDLCQQDLVSFLEQCYNVCKYNQQHLAEMRVKVRKEFPDRFFKFISTHA
jgi:hypothetical protein